ncbi:putative B3 domain-containing protein Os04g0347400 [Carex rostrata]
MMHVEDENKNRSVASVLSPIGKTWNIKLIRDHSETFFKGNWSEFSKYHKLEVGFNLVFRYEGNMVFKVKAFGLNGCLKDYNQDAVTIFRRIGFNASREKSPGKYASVAEGKEQLKTNINKTNFLLQKLPSQFMMHVEGEKKNRSVASVWSPRHKIWNIKLTRDHSETFFKGGWPEFSKFHKLEVGFKLVFRYEGNMVFKVKVFGLNGCLKDYNQGAEAILRRIGFNASREKSPAKCASVTEIK